MRSSSWRLTHQAREALERPRYPHAGVDLDEDALGRVDVDLEEARLVQRAVEEGEETLVRNVGPRVGNVAPVARQDALVVVAVQERVLCLLARGVLAPAPARHLVCFEAGLGLAANSIKPAAAAPRTGVGRCAPAHKLTCERTTIRRRLLSFSAFVLGTVAACGTMLAAAAVRRELGRGRVTRACATAALRASRASALRGALPPVALPEAATAASSSSLMRSSLNEVRGLNSGASADILDAFHGDWWAEFDARLLGGDIPRSRWEGMVADGWGGWWTRSKAGF